MWIWEAGAMAGVTYGEGPDLLLELLYQAVLLSAQLGHFLLRLLLLGGGQLQQSDVCILLTYGCQQCLLSIKPKTIGHFCSRL